MQKGSDHIRLCSIMDLFLFMSEQLPLHRLNHQQHQLFLDFRTVNMVKIVRISMAEQ
jgi:hypothetical protein